MGTVRKEKSKFIITLDNGKETYFDFADECYYGINGRKVQGFNKEALKILSEINDSYYRGYKGQYFFLVDFFLGRAYNWHEYDTLSPHIIESTYSIFYPEYTNSSELRTIALICAELSDKMDKRTYKLIKTGLTAIKKKSVPVNCPYLRSEILDQVAPELPSFVKNMVASESFTPEVTEAILADSKKIAFRYEHDCWESFLNNNDPYLINIKSLLKKYVDLCLCLHRERDYKDLIGSVGKMTKEADLLLAETVEDYQSADLLWAENDSFTVIVPTTAKEFQAEADYQRNCVFNTYYPEVLHHKTHIVFIRKRDDINTPYITCEVNNKGNIQQYLTRFNDRVTDKEAIKFKKAYQKLLTENFNKKEEI